MEILAALLCGPLDRLRGHETHIFNLRIFDKFFYALVLAAALGYGFDTWATAWLVVAMMLGMSPGWGTPLGAALSRTGMDRQELEWWQFGILERNAWLALAARGVIWGFPAVLVSFLYWDWKPLVYVPIFAIAMPLAAYLGPMVKLPVDRNDSWGRSEWIRGWLAGAMLLAVNLLSGGSNV